MEIYVARKKSTKSDNTYLVLEARAVWGTIVMTYEVGKILQIIPPKVDHRTLDEKGVRIGVIG